MYKEYKSSNQNIGDMLGRYPEGWDRQTTRKWKPQWLSCNSPAQDIFHWMECAEEKLRQIDRSCDQLQQTFYRRYKAGIRPQAKPDSQESTILSGDYGLSQATISV